ncbi:MAG: FHA domain-containing protein [Bacteroidaceae bacterium]|nr:FHA domain-containing protein [Bacteroidaceae bacterium]
MELTIGRQENVEKPRLKITTEKKEVLLLGTPGSVPKSVSRQHCKLTVLNHDIFIITNLKPENKTFVNGVSIVAKRIEKDERVELGKDKYLLDWQTIIQAMDTLPTTRISYNTSSYSINHLQQVWEQYSKAKLDMQIKQGRENAMSSVSGVFTMGAAACAFLPGVPNVLRIMLYIIAACLAGYFVFSRYRKASYYPKLQSDIDKRFRMRYICPNPDCQKFLGYQPYEELAKSKICIYCKCKYIKKD